MHPSALPTIAPKQAGFSAERLREAERLVEEAVRRGIPGAVLVVARRGAVALRKAWGEAAIRGAKRAMEVDALFDLASVTKCAGTALAIGALWEDARLGLDDPVERWLPAFGEAARTAQREGRERATLRHLLTHTAGLPAGGAFAGRTVTLRETVAEIGRSRRTGAPGERFLYSDFSAILLGAVVEAASGQRLDHFCHDRLFSRLDLADTRWRPGPRHAPRCAATTAGEDTPRTQGTVHDPTAAALERAGEVAGHAGLFSTGDDLARLASALLAPPPGFLRPETVAELTREHAFGRALGWDVSSDYAIRGALSTRSFGHTGFTGTSLWIDPVSGVAIVLLTNAVHAGAEARTRLVIPLRRAVSTAVAHAIYS